MLKFIARLVVAVAAVSAATVVTCYGVASAATFSVTSAACTGAGSFTAAVTAANANPGTDVISFAPGLKAD